jgi:hypothetical protein
VSAEPEGAFPSLAADGYIVSSPKTQAYNCVAWAAGDTSRWWEPGIYWPGPAGDDLASLVGLFVVLGYAPCIGDELEVGHEKVALYADDQGYWTHAARQLPDGWCTTKLGPDEDIVPHSAGTGRRPLRARPGDHEAQDGEFHWQDDLSRIEEVPIDANGCRESSPKSYGATRSYGACIAVLDARWPMIESRSGGSSRSSEALARHLWCVGRVALGVTPQGSQGPQGSHGSGSVGGATRSYGWTCYDHLLGT